MECSADENEKNAKWVSENRRGKLYASVSVLVIDVSPTDADIKVTFLALTRSGDSREPGRPTCVTVPWSDTNDDIWIQCPSTLKKGGSPPRPNRNATGLLYLEKRLVDEHNLYGTPKWPNSLPGGIYEQYEVWPTHVWVEGYAFRDEREPRFGKVDLLNEDWALAMGFTASNTHPPQQMELDGAAMELWLTPTGAGVCFGISSIASLHEAVKTIAESDDAHSVAHAVRTLATWLEISSTRPHLVTDEARDLIRRVLKTSAL